MSHVDGTFFQSDQFRSILESWFETKEESLKKREQFSINQIEQLYKIINQQTQWIQYMFQEQEQTQNEKIWKIHHQRKYKNKLLNLNKK